MIPEKPLLIEKKESFVGNRTSLVLASLLILLLAVSCKKQDTMQVDNETQSAADHAIIDQEFSTIISNIGYAAFNTSVISPSVTSTSNCDTLTLELKSTNSLEYSYNAATACSGGLTDGKTRAGSVKAIFRNETLAVTSRFTLKLSNYVSGGIPYSCDSIVMVVTDIKDNSVSASADLYGGMCGTGSNTIKYAFNKQFTMRGVGNTSAIEVYQIISGNAEGVNRSGRKFSSKILPGGLKKYRNCGYLVQGYMELSPQGFQTRLIDFGSGACDDLATFTVNENTVAFKLK